MGFDDQREELIQSFIKLMTQGGDDSFLVLSSGSVYLKYIAEPDIRSVYIEAVSNKLLPKDLQLNPEKISRLNGIGFKPQARSPNLMKTFSIPDESAFLDLADMSLKVLEKIYGVQKTSELSIELNM
jgi:hypothetical protein